MHNPPIIESISVNYQSTGGGYQSGGGGYQTPTGDSITITSPLTVAQVTDSNDNLSVSITYQSNGGGYQTPTWAYKIDSSFPAYGSPHGGTQVVGSTHRNDISTDNLMGKGRSMSSSLTKAVICTTHRSRSISVNYQSTGGGYQSGGGGYQTPTGDSITITSPANGSRVTDSNDNLSVYHLPVKRGMVTRHPHGHTR